MKNQNKAFICAGLTILFWSTVSTAFKLALQQMSPLQLITISMSISTLLLLIFIIITGTHKHLRQASTSRLLQSTLPGVILAIYYMVLFLAYDLLPAQIAQPINYSWALMLTLLSVLILKQKLCLKEFLWLLFAYSGILVISIGGAKHIGSLDSFGLICIIASTVLYALYWIYSTKTTLSNVNQLFMSFLTASILSLIALISTGGLTELLNALSTPKVLLPATYIALFELTIPFILWGMAMRYTESISRIASLPFLSPFLALFWVNLILKENIATSTYIGLCIIIIGTYMQQNTKRV